MDSLSTRAELLGGSIDVALTVTGDATIPARRIVRRRLSFPATADDGLAVVDVSDLFAPEQPPQAWADVERQRYLVINSVAEAGLLQAEIAAYTPQGNAQPTRVVVRVNRPSSVWAARTAYTLGTLVTPTQIGGFGYECTTAGTSGATPPPFPSIPGATVADGTAVWTSVGRTTPLWTLKVVDIGSVARVVTTGGDTAIFTTANATTPVGTVSVAPGTLTWTATGAAGITVGYDIVELQSTIATVDPANSNHIVLTTGIGAPWRPLTAYLVGALTRPTAPPTGYYYQCTTAGTSGATQPALPTTAGASVADNSAAWTCVGPAVVFRSIAFDQSFDPNTGTWTRLVTVHDREADRRAAAQPVNSLSNGATYYYASFLNPAVAWQATMAYQAGTLATPNPANGYGYQCTGAGTSGANAPAWPTMAGATAADGTAVWTCLGPDPLTASATATGAYGYAERLYGLLPEVDRFYDEPTPEAAGTGQLRRFLQIYGSGLDQTRSLADGLLSLHDVREVDATHLPRLARWIGWNPDLTQPEPLQRNDILFAPELFASVGTIPTLRALINRMSGWACEIKEFADNVFLTNGVEEVGLRQIFESTSATPGAGFAAPAPQANIYPLPGEPTVSQQDPLAFDARPAAAVDASGTVWLVWHSHRLGSEWRASTAYTAGSVLAPFSAGRHRYRCTTAGTSGTTPPAFPQTAGATVTDGTAIWSCTGAGIVRRRVWFQRLTVDPTPIEAAGDLPDDPSFFDQAPCALFDGTRIWVIWSSNRTGTVDIWARSLSPGNPPAPAPALQLTEDGVNDGSPAAVRDATGRIWVFFDSRRRGPSDIWATSSTDSGTTWSAPSRITTSANADHAPACTLDAANRVRLFFSSDTGDGCTIRQGSLTGTSWSFAGVTTVIPGFRDQSPAAVLWKGSVWLFWQSNRFGSTWKPSTAYATGDYLQPASPNGWYYQCTRAGTSGATQPAFPAPSGATVVDGGVVWVAVGTVATAGMTRRFRIWSATESGGAFGAPAPALTRLSDDAEPAAEVASAGALHLYFASQESGAGFRSRTVDTSTTPPTGRRQIANSLALASLHTYTDRMHYTYDTPTTTNPAYAGAAPIFARNTVGIYLAPDAATTSARAQQIALRVRALVAPFQPLSVDFIWYLRQPNGTYAPLFADVTRTLTTEVFGP
jgi:hypothetical protein